MIFHALTNSPKFDQALCSQLENKDFFFPESLIQWELRLPTLEDICGRCPHRIECREYALDNQITEGFWGGTTPTQRKKIIKTKEDRRSEAVREVQELLDLGYDKEQIAKKLGIQISSVDRRILRAKKKGIL